jgi:hypothetical protein
VIRKPLPSIPLGGQQKHAKKARYPPNWPVHGRRSAICASRRLWSMATMRQIFTTRLGRDTLSVNSTLELIGWLDLTKTLAIAGFCISLASLYFTWQNRRLVLAQERRRLPRLIPAFVDGYYRASEDDRGRLYAFHVTLTNPTDSDNAIATAELSITYQTADRVQMTMKLRANEPAAKSFVRDQVEALAVPMAVSAHGAVAGWLRFHVPAAMLANRDIEAYRLTFTDTHGETANVVPILVREYRDET